MLGLMQHHPLLISSLIEHACVSHPDAEIVSRTVEGNIHRCTYADVGRRSKQIANALDALDVKPGSCIGTLAWNGYRHMELYFGVSGAGSVLHTINPRLFAEQIEFIINDAKDEYLFFDLTFTDLIRQLAPRLKTVKAFIALCSLEDMPDLGLHNLLCYEELIADQSEAFEWPRLDENSASSLCYTSGTTGNPKGVLYSHRSSVLHSMVSCMASGFSLSVDDSILVVVPMFHVNAWGMPYSGALSGAKLVLPGPALDGANLYGLMRDERVTMALGVPTVWMSLQQHAESIGATPRDELCLNRVVIGGAAAPRTVVERFEKDFNARVVHAWGMTEMSPLGTVCHPLPKHVDHGLDQRLNLQSKQGRPLFGVSMKITDEEGRQLPHDGRSFGHLKVKGPWITRAYFGKEHEAILDTDGWFDTGDIATIDTDGYMQITDRAKDVIKSGGEWISSIDLENATLQHPAVAEAAVIGVLHEKWQERPLLIVVLRQGQDTTREELLVHLSEKVARWWLPDDVVFVNSLPHTATGKLQKLELRSRYREHLLTR